MVPSGLVGPLRWAVDLQFASVRIDGLKPPPADYAEAAPQAVASERPERLAFTHHGSSVTLFEDGTLPSCFLRFSPLDFPFSRMVFSSLVLGFSSTESSLVC